MKQALQQITLSTQNVVQPTILNQVVKPQNPSKRISELIHINTTLLDFGECLPASVHERKFSFFLTENLAEPITVRIDIETQDEDLSALEEFVFAIRREKEFSYMDSFLMKIQKKGCYDFIIGVKTPLYSHYTIQYSLSLRVLQIQSQLIGIKLKQKVAIPRIVCIKELVCQNDVHLENTRILKFCQIKGKSKKDIKVPFRFESNMKLTVNMQLIGLQDQFKQAPIVLKPKQICLFTRGQFIINFRINFPQQIVDLLQGFKGHKSFQEDKGETKSMDVRRVLVVKIDHTNFFYHFPIQINYMLPSKSIATEGLAEQRI